MGEKQAEATKVTENLTTQGNVYDNVFRTIVNDCKELLIPMVNEVFHEHFTGDEEIIFEQNEHFLAGIGGTSEEKITDTCFVIKGDYSKKYHWECQSQPDDSMLIRMFEYDSQIALDGGRIKDGVMTVDFPNSAILYLRSKEVTPDKLTIQIRTPGGDVTYDIPTMKIRDYDIEAIFEKQLYFLIPFYIFTHEKSFSVYNKDSKKVQILYDEYQSICTRLEDACKTGVITEYIFVTLIELSERVLAKIAKNYENVKKEVKTAMVGPVLDYPAKRFLMQGRKEGRAEGRADAYIGLVIDGLLTEEDAANRLEMSVDEFRKYLQES